MTIRSTTRGVRTVAAALCAIGLVSGCAPSDSTAETAGSSGTGWLQEYDLDGLDAREVIERLDSTPVADRPEDLIASVRPDELQLSDDAGHQATLDMPEDEFYMSVAPYVDRTHDCSFHSLTTCLGELDNAPVEVTVTDADDQVVLEKSTRTYDNGFAGIWLPRDIDATLTVEQGKRKGTQDISTSEDDPTCLTTLGLT